MRNLVILGALFAASAAAAGGLGCQLAYSCAADACTAGDIRLRIEERDGQAGVVSGDDFIAVDKRTDAETGWVTYVTPVDNFELYFMTVLPDGRAMASGHSAGALGDLAEPRIYTAFGTCEAVE